MDEIRSPIDFSAVKVAVVGAGYWGRNHVRVFSQLGSLAAICDAECRILDGMREQYSGVICTDRYADVLLNPEINGVIIATPASTHYELARAALEAGKDVLVEKPLALNAVDGQELVSLSQRKAAVLMVGHILLYHPAVLRLKEIIDQGELGKIQYIHSNRLSMGKVRSEENILWSFAPHDISMVLFLLDEVPNEVNAVGFCHLQREIEDVTISTLNFPSGVGSHIHVCWMNPFKEHRLVVIGDKKTAVFEDSLPDKKLQIFDCNFEWVNRTPLPHRGDKNVIEVDLREPLKEECMHFLHCISTRQNPRSDGQEGLRTLKVLQRCYDSLKSKAQSPSTGSNTNLSGQEYFAHPSAVIDEKCCIGKGTKIWHFSHVMEGAEIGKDCNIGQNVVIGRGVKVGTMCKIQNNVSVYEGVTIEDHVFCGPSMVFTNVFNPRSEIPRMEELRPTLVKSGATIGANSTIICGNTIGTYAFVGAGSVVTSDVEDHALVVGSPARRVGWMCRCGNKLMSGNGDNVLRCSACEDVYRESPNGGLMRSDQRVESVPLLDLKAQYRTIKKEVNNAVARVVEAQHFIMGPEVEALEKDVAAYCGCKHAIGVSSGTDALLLSLMALGISPGDEVITTPFTFFATAGCIHRLFAKPVFSDINPRTFNIDPARIEKSITAKTKAIIPVHLFGQCADMDPIMDLANRYGLHVVEDAAQAIGSEYHGRRAGSMGAVGCFSFFPSKNLGAFGDGGMITTNDHHLADRIRTMRSHGAKPKYFHEISGGNFRLDAIQAAVLRTKLPHLDSWIEKRRAHANYYSEKLSSLSDGRLRLQPPGIDEARHVFNQYVIRIRERDELVRHLKRNGIGTEIYYPVPLHLQQCFADLGHGEGDYPESEQACKEVLALPVYPELSRKQQDYVIEKIKEVAY